LGFLYFAHSLLRLLLIDLERRPTRTRRDVSRCLKFLRDLLFADVNDQRRRTLQLHNQKDKYERMGSDRWQQRAGVGNGLASDESLPLSANSDPPRFDNSIAVRGRRFHSAILSRVQPSKHVTNGVIQPVPGRKCPLCSAR